MGTITMRKFNKFNNQKENKNERDDGIIRQEVSKSSYKCVQEYKRNMNIMRMEQNIFFKRIKWNYQKGKRINLK